MTAGDRPAAEEPRLALRRRSASAWSRRGFLTVFLPALALVLIGATALGTSGNALLPFERVITLEGKMASKRDFFEDEKVRRILLKHHIRIHITSVGSREVAIRDLDDYDFVFPSGQPAGDLITRERAEKNEFTKIYRPFVSPIVLASYREYAEVLAKEGIAEPQPASGKGEPLYYTLDMDAFLELIEKKRQWDEIGIEDFGITNTNRILAQTPDVCTANSASTYLALVAFTRRGEGSEVPETSHEAEERAHRIKPLMEQGLPHADVFRTYVSPEGKGVAPVVVAYEHQYLTYQAHYLARSKKLDLERVLLYPKSQFVTQPQFIALNKDGDRLGQLITQDPELRRRAMELGFRILDPTGEVAGDQLTEFLRETGIPVPSVDDDTRTAMPRLRLLERMISIIGDCSGEESG
ncbi:hypothetical protein GCM10010387_62400 [Streptomyces inusitatus]|uniref:Extracellular solute-binding protein n=1 Tax=Streptomyces inusitatus TaxID=68221 RepID=A0A918V2F1_9ACTN|nr:hypothetical protein [Streptomyces inusitatus]GGZ60231.1 hypothetical protein GCM10010387_62400 [Streptomyces inusitatus]